jgi:hypothetical protein
LAFSREIEEISGFTQIKRVETPLEPRVAWKDDIARQHLLHGEAERDEGC